MSTTNRPNARSDVRTGALVNVPWRWLLSIAIFLAAFGMNLNARADELPICEGTITANVVVFDSPTVFNRLGAQNPNWIMYALERDVVDAATDVPCSETECTAGNVRLRPDKRPRPLVLRSIEGYCLDVNFTNLLNPVANPNDFIDNPESDTDNVLINNDQVAGRCAGIQATGTELRDVDDVGLGGIGNDGSLVGHNHPASDVTTNCGTGDQRGSLVGPDTSITYHLYTPREGAFLFNSLGATLGSEANGGNLGIGMFGALNVQPRGARIYRSQVTEEEFRLATAGNGQIPSDCTGDPDEIKGIDCNRGGQPIVDYDVLYPDAAPWNLEGKADLPVLNMLHGSDGNYELVHGDINAIIVGPNADGSFPASTYPLESSGSGHRNPTLPNRLEPFREFTSVFHDEQTNSQVFPRWYNDPVLGYTLHGVGDAFMINYGSGGIGSEIIANRLHAGPMHDCTDCAYEEFFLSSSTVGDPAMLVNFPANTGIEACDPNNILSPACWRQFGDDPLNPVNGGQPIGANPPIPGNYALYQEDPSNVHHAYTGDFTKVRNIHAGAFEQHIFHLHNHQWLFNPNDDNANYLDAQEIMPGSGHTYELVNGGVGNRNKTAGDAIFHCHFYPHFAQGMWYHIRIMDTMETGTRLAVSTPVDTTGDGVADAGDINGDGYHDAPFDLRSGKPAPMARALPDGELPDGTPIPAIVPLPGKAMPPMPAPVMVQAVDRGDFGVLSGRRPPNGLGQGPDSSQAYVDRETVKGEDGLYGTADDISPGYPFWLAGVSCGVDGGFGATAGTGDDVCPEGIIGQRMPTPPLDMLTAAGAEAEGYHSGQAGGWDGGLPRHALRGYTSGGVSLDTQNRLDFRKIVEIAKPVYFSEVGTPLEKASMAFQGSIRNRPSAANNLSGTGYSWEDFVQNGAPPVPGGPFNDPCVDDNGVPLTAGVVGNWFDAYGGTSVLGNSEFSSENPRTYRIANIQIDAVFNKVGYHYPQERIIALWGDVARTIEKDRPPEPLVMRYNTFDCGKLLHTNLVPHEFELDDFQVRTPTDIIGQHIHLPKWDLTTNDGAANGWNYEDGALAPGIVQERIHAINNYNKLAGGSHNLVTLLLDLGFEADDFPADLLTAIADHEVDLTDLTPVATIDTEDAGSGSPTLNGDFCLDEFGDPAECAGGDVYDYSLGLTQLAALPHPYFGNGEMINGHHEYAGARTVIQRMLIDPVLNLSHKDRGLGLTFSHDHYGPSTFQQIGLYSTILAEPAGSTWRDNETGELLGQAPDGTGGRMLAVQQVDPSTGLPTTVNVTDGGPTSWQAAIITDDSAPVGAGEIPDHREFYFEMSDFQHAYEKGVYVGADDRGKPVHAPIDQGDYFNATTADAGVNDLGFDLQETWQRTVNPPLKLRAATPFPDVVTAEPACPGPNGNADPNVTRPCAEAINISHSSMWVVNYRNEPIGLRVFDPSKTGPDNKKGAQADGKAGDLAFAFQSRKDRAISDLNTSFGDTPYPPATNCSGNDGDGINCDRRPGDPFTPIMRAYEKDEVKIKIQVGATEEQHQSSVHGLKWLSNGSAFGESPNSGWRNFQSHGISEQFSLSLPLNDDPGQTGNAVDYLYLADATRDGVWTGAWGILRSYGSTQQDLYELPDNRRAESREVLNRNLFNGVCPAVEMDENGDPILFGKGRNKQMRPLVPREFDVVAVLANKALQNNLNVTIPGNEDGDSDGNGTGDNAGGPLNTDGGTLVYNRRASVVPGVDTCAIELAEGEVCPPGDIIPGVEREGPLNDPTAMMYVRLEDLAPRFIPGVSPDLVGELDAFGMAMGDGIDDRCQDVEVIDEEGDGVLTVIKSLKLGNAACPVMLSDDAPVEPLVLRANAGDCIEVTVHNKLLDQALAERGAAMERIFSCEVETTVDEFGVETSSCAAGDLEPLFTLEEAQEVVADGRWVVFEDGTQVPPDLTGDPFGLVTFELIPDLAGLQDMFWVVNRDLFNPIRQPEMHFFNNNLVRPSSYVGIHAQLVEYDVSRDDGVVVGQNNDSGLVPAGAQSTFRYYAGHLERALVSESRNRKDYKLQPTPIEFGGTNLLSADRIKQPQKGLFGALIIEPMEASWPDALADLEKVPDGQGSDDMTRRTRAQVNVQAEDPEWAGIGGSYREAALIGHKITNLRWADGTAVANIHQGELGREGAEDSGHAGFNYGMEPSWFRFGLQPDAPFGNAMAPNSFGMLPNVHAFYANDLANNLAENAIPVIANDVGDLVYNVSELGDPATPVFRAEAGVPARIHLLNGASADRDGTFVLNGHVWQRDPFVCREEWQDDQTPLGTVEGRCDPDAIGSQALGLNPLGKWMGSEEGMGHVYAHWPILIEAGGSFHVQGDFLFRDYGPNGNRNGQFGLLRVLEAGKLGVATPPDNGDGDGDGGGKGGGKGRNK